MLKKKLYFTVDERWSDKINGIKVYQEFEYDTTTNELKFIDRFDDEIKEISIGTASLVSSENSGSSSQSGNNSESGTTSGDTTSGNTDDPSGATSGDTTSGETSGATSGTIQSYEDIEVTTSTPLTFRSVGTTTLQLKKNSSSTPYRNIQYSKNNGEWQDYPIDGIFQLADGDTVAFSGNNVNGFSNNNGNHYTFKSEGDGTIELYGNIMSLVNSVETIATASQFESLFEGCTTLTKASKLLLPSNTTQACYAFMFKGCTNLVETPTFPATSLASQCYYEMFKGDAKLESINVSFTSWVDDTVTDWVNGVAESGTFTKPSTLTQENGNDRIPEGWTIVNK